MAAPVFMSQLLMPVDVLRVPGIDKDKPKPEKAYYTLSDFCSIESRSLACTPRSSCITVIS